MLNRKRGEDMSDSKDYKESLNNILTMFGILSLIQTEYTTRIAELSELYRKETHLMLSCIQKELESM